MSKRLKWIMKDEGFEEYLDGITSRYTIKTRHEIIAYCFKEDRARLIAAAPDMLEALEEAETTEGEYGRMCPVCYCIQDKHQMHNAGCKLQAALALAKEE